MALGRRECRNTTVRTKTPQVHMWEFAFLKAAQRHTSVCFLPTPPIIHQLQKSCLKKKTLVGACANQQKMPCSSIKGGKIINKGDRAMDVASFREILQIQRLGDDEFFQKCVTGCQQGQTTSDKWNGFWTPKTASKMEEKRKEDL